MAAVENAINQAAFIMEHFEKRWAEKIICARRGRFPRLTLEDLTQIVQDGCAPSPQFTVPHYKHSAVSSFFDQCTEGELLVN